MKADKTIAAGLTILMIIALTACGRQESEIVEEPAARIANPWVDCGAPEEAAETAGFPMEAPDQIEGYPNTQIQAVKDSMIQVFYYDKDFSDDDNRTVLIRKGAGEDDISGDYNVYEEKDTVSMHGADVNTRGKAGRIHTATRTRDGYSYSISADDGLEAAQLEELVGQVK